MRNYAFYRKVSKIPLDLERDFRNDILKRANELGVFEKGMYSKTGRGDMLTATIKLYEDREGLKQFIEYVNLRSITFDEPQHPL